MNHHFTRVATLVLATTLAGCGSAYLESKRYTATGGQMERDQQAANADLSAAQRDNARLQQTTADRDQEIAQDSRRIRSLEVDLGQQNARLKAAFKDKRISQSRHAKFKRELDAIRAETQNVAHENQSATLVKTSNSKADPAKAERLRKLEQRKTQLDAELKALAGS